MITGIVVAVITWLALVQPTQPKPGVLEMRVVRWQSGVPTPGTLPYRRLVQVMK